MHSTEELKNIEIYNIIGEKVLSVNMPTKYISVEMLQSGIYFLHANNYIKKFVIN